MLLKYMCTDKMLQKEFDMIKSKALVFFNLSVKEETKNAWRNEKGNEKLWFLIYIEFCITLENNNKMVLKCCCNTKIQTEMLMLRKVLQCYLE